MERQLPPNEFIGLQRQDQQLQHADVLPALDGSILITLINTDTVAGTDRCSSRRWRRPRSRLLPRRHGPAGLGVGCCRLQPGRWGIGALRRRPRPPRRGSASASGSGAPAPTATGAPGASSGSATAPASPSATGSQAELVSSNERPRRHLHGGGGDHLSRALPALGASGDVAEGRRLAGPGTSVRSGHRCCSCPTR